MGGFSPHFHRGKQMFFAYITSLLIIIGFLYLAWKKIGVPLLESKGIQVYDDEPIITDHTKQLEKLKAQFEDLSASAKAANDGLALAKQIKKLEAQIADAEAERKKL
jgi:hypothetical protein